MYRNNNTMLFVTTLISFVVISFLSSSDASSLQISSALGLKDMVVAKAMQSPEVFTNVMSELKDVALTLKANQDEDMAMTDRVKVASGDYVTKIVKSINNILK